FVWLLAALQQSTRILDVFFTGAMTALTAYPRALKERELVAIHRAFPRQGPVGVAKKALVHQGAAGEDSTVQAVESRRHAPALCLGKPADRCLKQITVAVADKRVPVAARADGVVNLQVNLEEHVPRLVAAD